MSPSLQVSQDSLNSHFDRDVSSKANGESDAAVTRGTGLLSPKLGPDKSTSGKPANANKRGLDKRSDMPDGDNSGWIHRDKLAKIESQELQAAGIYLPKPRSQSNATRDASQNGAQRNGIGSATYGSKNDSTVTLEPRTPETSHIASWDLRLPEEVEEADVHRHFASLNGQQGLSRIPIAKVSPVPIPLEYLERDTPILRKSDHSPTEEYQLMLPKTRARSISNLKQFDPNAADTGEPIPKRAVTEGSPKKAEPRKNSVGAGSINGAKRGVSASTASAKAKKPPSAHAARPTTRSGVRDKAPPEGDPPWMVSAYAPDPRLPPDQQLLPTVARRLQQEKWEKEGKFGNVYDRDFRPLTSDGFLTRPTVSAESAITGLPHTEQDQQQPFEKTEIDWPLKLTESGTPGTPASPNRAGSYSTMPKIQDKPLASPLTNPRGQSSAGLEAQTQPQQLPDVDEKNLKKTKRGCCVMM